MLNLFYIVMISIGMAAESGTVGQLANVQGAVYVDDVTAKEGTYLKKGSVIKTEEGRASVMLGQETVMHLDRHATLKVDDYIGGKKGESGQIDLQRGATRTLVKNLGSNIVRKNFFIRTKAAVMGVRGTEVFVSAPIDKPPTFAVVRGEALIQTMPSAGIPGKEFMLKGGQSIVTQVSTLSTLQVENRDQGKLAEQAQEIAPPPQKVETKRDMDQFMASSDPFRMNPNVIPGQGVGFPFDPLLNGGRVSVGVNIGNGTKY